MNKVKKMMIVCMLLTVCLTTNKLVAQTNGYNQALTNADTTNFSVNQQDGWITLNSYIALKGTDSIRVEAIVRRMANNIAWTQDQYIGKIKPNSLRPVAQRIVGFNMLSNLYQLTINPDGKCYIRLVTGTPPNESAPIIPVMLTIKR